MAYEHEAQRTRERLHKLESSLIALNLNVKALRATVDAIGPKVDQLAKADEIAAAVSEHMSRNRKGVFSRNQRVVGYLGVALVAADLVSHWFGY